ncbi:MAG: agmatinase [Candidatus Tectomicrobia bacterium]|nr:agmatinase [Candidatus Tectomicrobia bacterium]
MKRFQPVDAFISPRFSGVPTFMRLPQVTDPSELDIALIGVPFDGGTTYKPGARLGPRQIRLESALIRPFNPVLKVNPFEKYNVGDVGDVNVNPLSIEDSYTRIENAIDNLLNIDVRPICVGGDHSITLPILRSIAKKYGPVGVIHFDAHSDTWDSYFGMKYSHGTPFRRAIEEGLIDSKRFIQIGIRGQVYDQDDFKFPEEHGIEIIQAEELFERGINFVKARMKQLGSGRYYVSLDIDALDPAYAPGTGTPQVGGLTSYQMISLVRGLQGFDLVGFDLVEVSPPLDVGGITSLLAANLLFEFLCVVTIEHPRGMRE